MKIINSFFYNSPPWIQNILISIYGIKIFWRRYAGKHDYYLKNLNASENYSCSEIITLQTKLFRNLIYHVFTNVPFYIRLSQKTGITARDFKSISDIHKLPIVDKEMVRKNPIKFCSIVHLQKMKFRLHTSGTTGKSLTIFCDPDSRRHHYSFWTRLRQQYGVGKGMKRATFFGRVLCPPTSKKPPFWRYDAVGLNLLFSSYHMIEDNLYAYCNKLIKFQPAEIIGYASSIFLLSKYMNKHKIRGINPIVIFTTAEKLLPHQRSMINKAFSCPLVDQYGCAEMATFIAECRHGTFHLHPEHGILEVVNEANEVVPPGSVGEAVCTGFINMTMPLIRYKLGDFVSTSHRKCRCGSHFQVIETIEGRVDDIVYSKSGKPIGRFSPIWKLFPGISETQVVQSTLNHLDINIVVDQSFHSDSNNKKELLNEIIKRTGSDMNIEFHFMDNIPKNHNGKFRAVISKIDILERCSDN